VRVEAAEHVADDTRTLHRLGRAAGTEAQAHALHRIQDAALHRLLPVAHIGQRAALDHAQGIFEVGAFSVVSQRDGVVGIGRRGVE
jgi:hypothetical protein